MRLALATCRNLPDWEADDRFFHAALVDRGVEFEQVVWDDPVVDWQSFDACLVRTTWDYYEKHAAFLEWIERAGRVTRLFNPPEVVRWNATKLYLRELERDGTRIAPTVWLERGETVDVARALEGRDWGRAFLKPLVGATSRETLRFDSTVGGLREAQERVDRLLACESLMLQRYLSRVETEGELSFIYFDGELSHTVRKIPVPGDYRVQDDFGATDELFEATGADRELARSVLDTVHRHFAAAAPLVYARLDFLRDESGALCVNEVELIEPSLFFRHSPRAGERLADVLIRRT